MPDTAKEMYAEMRTTWEEMKQDILAQVKEVKANGFVSAETNQKLDRLTSRIDELEVKMNRPGMAGGETMIELAERQEKRRAFVTALKVGIAGLSPEYKKLVQIAGPEDTKALSVGDDTLGGYLAPPDFVEELVKTILQYSPVRQVATVRQTTKASILIPTRTGTHAARWVSETGTRSETTGLTYGQKEIVTNELYAEVLISNQMLEDAVFNMDAEIQDESSLQFLIAEGTSFVKGSGVGQPEGFMTNASVSTVVSGSAAALTYNGLVDLVHTLKTPYALNASFMMNRKTVGGIRKLVDSQNRPLWEPGLAPGDPAQIMGYRYYEAPDMDDIGTSTYPIAFGDWKRAYYIVDRVNVIVQRLVEKYADTGQVAYLIRKRTGARVVLAEAIIKHQCHT